MRKKKEKKPSKTDILYREAGISRKKNVTICLMALFASTGVGVALYLKTKQIISLLIPVLLGLAIDIYFLYSPKLVIEKRKAKLEDEFTHVFSYFSIFVGNGRPVYNALDDCLRYSSMEMGNLIRDLLDGIDADKSLTPFLNFASHFQNLEIRQVMISVYRMGIDGNDSNSLNRFQSIFESLASIKRSERVDSRRRKLSNLNSFPLLASALSMGMIAIAVLVLMEGYSGVI